ncbi:37250_t:CDS:2 [Gigaspora margarita]|uniref:37250_t:CDS:1 n=1 Tax=Gigaspora margarita TaxID=4874 RepID=A0ABN7WUN0_GIGMA|nr:37250_t:CDS:2 [Gigaspora margarita]
MALSYNLHEHYEQMRNIKPLEQFVQVRAKIHNDKFKRINTEQPIMGPIPQMRNIKPLEQLHDCEQKCETASHGPIPQPFEQKYEMAAINIKTKILHENNDHYEQK